jgi:CRP/FNR family transcriptional regulator, anaerobic regulatory protein
MKIRGGECMASVEASLTDALAVGRRKLTAAFSASPPRPIGRGELLTAPGCRSAIFRLRAGWAYHYREFSNGRTAVLDIYLPGDLIGLDALFGTRQLKAVSTLTSATLEVIPAENGLSDLIADRSIALYICWLLGQRQRRTDRRLAANAHLEPEARLAMMLLDFCVRLRRQRLIIGLTYNLPLTQTQIGDYLSLSAIHVNGVLRSFRDDRVVSLEKSCVTILNIERLKTLARGQPAPAPASPVVDTATRIS